LVEVKLLFAPLKTLMWLHTSLSTATQSTVATPLSIETIIFARTCNKLQKPGETPVFLDKFTLQPRPAVASICPQTRFS
jgi:hypothetical protein